MQAGSSLTYYRRVMVYNGNTISYLLHPEGTIQHSSNGWVYNYRLTDHTGSTRVLLEGNSSGLTVVQTNEYYPFGLSFAYNNLDRNKYLFSGKEYQDALLGGRMLGLYDFGSRYYNPVLGRWFCQDPALQLVSPYEYCGNNPVRYVDPDGAKFFHWILAGLGLTIPPFFYEIQKFMFPLAITLDFPNGTHQNGIGFNFSIGDPLLALIGYRYEGGASYYFDSYGHHNGWEVRSGGSWTFNLFYMGVPDYLSFSGTRFSGSAYPEPQTTYRLKFGNAVNEYTYENDTYLSQYSFPGLPKSDSHSDAYRTAAASIKWGPMELGMILHTGKAEKENKTYINGIETWYWDGGSIRESSESNGILYGQFGPFRIGWDSEEIRHFFQNRFAHDFFNGGSHGSSYPWVLKTGRKDRPFFQLGWPFGGTMY